MSDDAAATRRAIFVGDEPLTAQCVDVARNAGLDVVLVVTDNAQVAAHAAEREITVVGGRGDVAGAARSAAADVLFSVANLRVLPDAVLAAVATAINFHDGPLPTYAGLNVTNWALLDGVVEHGITWHVMTSDVDGGAVVASERFPVAADETGFSLNARCYEAALTSFPAVAAAVARGEVTTTPQPAGERHYFGRHDRPAVVVDPTRPAADIARAVRALDFGGRRRNPLGLVRWVVDNAPDIGVAFVEAAEVADQPSGAEPGTVVALDARSVTIATIDGDLTLTGVVDPDGASVDVAAFAARHGIAARQRLADVSALGARLAAAERGVAPDELYWVNAAATTMVVASPRPGPGDVATATVATTGSPAEIVAATAVWAARRAGTSSIGIGVTSPSIRATLGELGPTGQIPVVGVDVSVAGDQLRTAADRVADQASRRGAVVRDAYVRDPRTRGRVGLPGVVVHLDADSAIAAAPGAGHGVLEVLVGVDGTPTVVRGPAGDAERVAEELSTLLTADWRTPAESWPIVGAVEQSALDAVNDTAVEFDATTTIDRLFAATVAARPDQPAVSFGDATWTYRQLDDRSLRIAAALAASGVATGSRVGIALGRSADMVAAVLATLRLGAAYVPLDPTYPLERLQLMVNDSGLSVIVVDGPARDDLTAEAPDVTILPIGAAVSSADVAIDAPTHAGNDLAYVIYTSGSTGTPKGVMLEHRQVVNFFVAMDAVIDRRAATDAPAGIWLAVTSLSFDISVLELLWTVTRGFHVVVKSDSGVPKRASTIADTGPTRPVSFSLFYFAADQHAAADGYRLLLDSARFADEHGFEAVWTPERHFHDFGGAYPNPSVTSAALAVATRNVKIRAGSVVLPLHSPARVAEEWAVVDNLSGGRVGISFAPGWQPNDFVLNPSAYATARADLGRNIGVVQRLWRGEAVEMAGHDGAPVPTTTLPRPVQAELPTWLTSAGTPETFERAGTLGVNLLTHLLGQSIEQLTDNIARYRAAWTAAGHAGDGQVTLMMHTYVDTDGERAIDVAREPMKRYLGTSVGLLRDVASSFPTFANKGGASFDELFASLDPDELDQLLSVAADRYLTTSGLFGTVDEVAAVVEQVSAAGVDEVACLIDFGIDTTAVLASLELLESAKRLVAQRRVDTPASADSATITDVADDSVAVLTERHGVTHLQCTPSLAAMLALDPADRAALSTIGHLMVGGEALPPSLATELRQLLGGRLTNMYGPTETTIWSLVHELIDEPGSVIPIGAPIANNTVHVLDAFGNEVPFGVFGELHIGGDGVARGYHNRPELTAERFVERPRFGRTYATGDLVRLTTDGVVEFGGRIDNQVKIRGHRIELGEIEAVLEQHLGVQQAIVVARADGDSAADVRLVAYLTAASTAAVPTSAELRATVAGELPEVMVPSAFVVIDAFALTPNGKVDRKALQALPPPTGDSGRASATTSSAPPASELEAQVAAIWSAELGVDPGRDDNFFEIGGHSLLAVKIFRRIVDALGAPIALTDIFRYPTIKAFAAHLAGLADGADGTPPTDSARAATGVDRGAMRRRAMARRGGDE